MAVLLRGGCPCDAVRFEISEVFDAGYCHCNRCRKHTGAPVFAFVHVPRAAFNLLSGELIAEPWERLGQGMICGSCRGRSRLAVHFFFFNDTATPEIYTLSLHDALPI